MSNKDTAILPFKIIFLLLGMMGGTAPAFSAPLIAAKTVTEKAVTEKIVKPEPLTVTNVLIDKTDKNAVMARDQAIIDARRTALHMLAERALSPDELKAFKFPEDRVIAALVRDFEIKKEKISAVRYVANFTVRFNKKITNYISMEKLAAGEKKAALLAGVKPTAATLTPAAADEKTATPEKQTTEKQDTAKLDIVKPLPKDAAQDKTVIVEGSKHTVLVLPYFETMAGKKQLWGDTNPWLAAWIDLGASSPTSALTVTVPLGDISDISVGDSDAVWSQDYSTLERLGNNYKADEVFLAVLNKSGVKIQIDTYRYADKKLTRLKSITPYHAETDDHNAYKLAVQNVLQFLQAPAARTVQDTNISTKAGKDNAVQDIAQQILNAHRGAGAETDKYVTEEPPETIIVSSEQEPAAEPAVAAEETATDASAASTAQTELAAKMGFNSFSQWIEIQKRLSHISPPVALELSSLNKDTAAFRIKYNGDIASLKNAMASEGIALNPPALDKGAFVYILHLIN